MVHQEQVGSKDRLESLEEKESLGILVKKVLLDQLDNQEMQAYQELKVEMEDQVLLDQRARKEIRETPGQMDLLGHLEMMVNMGHVAH